MSGTTWRPALPTGSLLRHDATRGTDVLLLPERVVVLHGSARAVLTLCDGTRTADEVATHIIDAHPQLARRADVSSFLYRLHAKGCLK
ncbi:pyrroloquinoline quinone biosynthesis peptide chaperone PqqD [Streptomyces sp. NBC_01445]|uniref:pyrroloquinoline quinone biosynthesis peptide chaperone PqqD n=1 Tax=Streptomyces sp. NBC_01445 TaxID=2903869 RepID=UPI002DD9AAF3|nr:pyrroloquinoline quinone biosynthesis peptide chaperone PqqD [Streptomyces sp. NBC_01445]WSE09221.1 pyrroloquinoline quinone biosynthesis peptide chaperone PqqD [Streptomyces sp. NBC_01445]